ncbi:MAG: LysM peptidoglycan-binding domain-containing protein [Bacteroidia bacterium]
MFFKKLNIFLFLLLLAVSTTVLSQTDGKSKNIQTINGKKYYLHKVEKGQSIYAISKIYNTGLNAIFLENPDAIDGIKAGQELKIPFAKETVPAVPPTGDLNNYVIHKVGKSETVYGICKRYSITEARFAELNPDIKQGLKEGQIVKVGLKDAGPVQIATTSIEPYDSAYKYHTVEQGESIYAITKKYTITAEELQKWNPSITSGIKTGQKLKVGLNRDSSDPAIFSPPVVIADTVPPKPKKQNYTVGVFLPFHFAEGELISVEQLVSDRLPFPITQQITIDFYEGMAAALDSLKSSEFNVSYRLFDVDERDSLKLDRICSDENFKTLDLIIGPLYTSAFRAVSASAKKNGIPVVSPLTQQNKILFDNPFVSKTTPANNTLIEGLAEFAADSCRSGNVMIVNMNRTLVNQASKVGKAELSMIRAFKAAYNEIMASRYGAPADTVKEVPGLAGAKAAYVAGKKNYYVVLSDDQVFLSDFLTQIYVFSEKKESYVIGMRSWVGMENIDPEHLNKLNFTYATPFYVDLNSDWVKTLTLRYRAKYFTDPSDFYYQGYDVAFYYLNALKTTGPSFYADLEANKKQGAVMSFNFFRPSQSTGFDNKSIQVIRYRDYKFKKVR